jgi:hypothetical protein
VLNTVSSIVWDAQGYVEINAVDSQTTGDMRRRGNRIATLDGGAVTNDAGFSDADRTFEIRWLSTDTSPDDLVARLVRLYGTVQVSVRDGVYTALVESYKPGATEAALRLLVLSKISA